MPLGTVVKRVYPAYQAKLAASNAVDFDDLLLHVATLLRENPEVRAGLDERYRFILVDEYQDTNLAQYAIARALSIDHPNLAVTGDPDQSIYGWRGANLNNILEFEKDFPEVRVVRLERNYRSTKRILRVAVELISHNLRRKEKGLYTENGAGPPVRLVTYRHAKGRGRQTSPRRSPARSPPAAAAPRDFAIFYRINALSRAFEFALREQGVPYQMVNGLEFFQRKEIKDVLAYLQLLNNPHDEMALLRVINTPPRGIGKTTIDRLAAHADAPRPAAAGRRPRRPQHRGDRRPRRRAGRASSSRCSTASRPSPAAQSRRFWAWCWPRPATRSNAKASGDAEDDERLANIQELLTVAREFDERTAAAAPGGVSGRDQPGQRHRRLGDRRRPRHADDAARLEGAGVSRRLPRGRGRGAAAARAEPRAARQLEEERRLMFVGITRRKQELQISLAAHRDFRGSAEADDSQLVSDGIAAAEMDVQVVPRRLAPCAGAGTMAEEEAGHSPRRATRRHADARRPFARQG